MLLMILSLVLGGMLVSGIIPLGWLVGEHEVGTTTLDSNRNVELVKGKRGTVFVPDDVREALGIRKGKKDQVAIARRPTTGTPLVLPGSTALDPTRLLRIRARFAPAEVVKIGEFPVNERGPDGKSLPPRELRSGDLVSKGTVLGVFYSADVGNKKNDLYDAVVQSKLDEKILDNYLTGRGSVPEIYILNAQRNVIGDRNAITRAENTLRTWNVPPEDIDAVREEAEKVDLNEIKSLKAKAKDSDTPEEKARKAKEEKERLKKLKQEQLDRWARVELKAPFDCTIIERNVAKHEIIADPTTNLFVLARVNRIAVIVNAPEDDLPTLQALSFGQRHWTISTVGAPTDKPFVGPIDEIGYLIDPNQHTAVLKGYIDNPGSRLRAGQFVSVKIDLPPPEDVVEIPMDAIVDDGKQCVVFVQPDPDKPEYTLRRVLVTHRFDKVAFVRSKLTASEQKLKPEEKDLGVRVPEPLRVGERVITAGVLELKKELEDKEAAEAK
jgi:cobalt-zinc-cadmium efflux system membrane fusion protein